MDNVLSIAWWRGIFLRFGTGCVMIMLFTLVIGFGWSQFSSRSNNPRSEQSERRDEVALTVNGQPITQAQIQARLAALTQRGTPPAGPQYAALQGQAILSAVQSAVIEQVAKEQNVRPSDADVDRAIAAEREQALSKGASDSDWESYVAERHGMTAAEYRDARARDPQILLLAFANDLKAKEKVTDDEVKNQSAEVRLNVVLLPTLGGSAMFAPPKGVKLLTDEDGKKKADALRAKVVGGSDIAAIARTDSADFNAKKGGDTDFQPEYQTNSQSGMPDMGALRYGKAFDEAVHKTAVGQVTDVVKAEGFQKGYVFARVAERRNNLPKDFDLKKATEALKEKRAQQKMVDLLQSKIKAANVVVKDPDKKPYYDYVKVQQDAQEAMMAQMSGGSAPTKVDQDKQQAALDQEFEDLLKKHPDDATLAALVAQSLETRKATAPDTKDRLIALYNTVLKSTEDRAVRFKLAGLYAEKKQNDLAITQYDKIAKYLGYNPPTDLASMRDTQAVYQQLETGYRAVGRADAADKVKQQNAELQPKIAAAAAQEEADRKAAQAAQTPAVTVPPGKSVTVTPGEKGASAAPKTPAPSAPTGNAAPPAKK